MNERKRWIALHTNVERRAIKGGEPTIWILKDHSHMKENKNKPKPKVMNWVVKLAWPWALFGTKIHNLRERKSPKWVLDLHGKEPTK